jgi:hypothetical protein
MNYCLFVWSKWFHFQFWCHSEVSFCTLEPLDTVFTMITVKSVSFLGVLWRPSSISGSEMSLGCRGHCEVLVWIWAMFSVLCPPYFGLNIPYFLVSAPDSLFPKTCDDFKVPLPVLKIPKFFGKSQSTGTNLLSLHVCMTGPILQTDCTTGKPYSSRTQRV